MSSPGTVKAEGVSVMLSAAGERGRGLPVIR